MGKVVALRVLERQLDVVKLGIGRNIHRQTRAGKMARLVEADVMFNHRGLRPLRQLKMMAIVRGVDFVAVQPLGDVHQQQRLCRTLVTLHADMRHAAGQALGQVQENLRLNRGAQWLAIVVYHNLKSAPLKGVAQLRTELTVDKHQAHGIHVYGQRVTLRRGEIRQTGHELGVQQAIKRGIFPVLMLTRRQAETQHLLKMLLRLLRARAALGFKQPVPLLERITAVR